MAIILLAIPLVLGTAALVFSIIASPSLLLGSAAYWIAAQLGLKLLSGWVYFNVWLGRRWARVVLLVLVAWHAIQALPSISIYVRSRSALFLYNPRILSLLLEFAALVLLFVGTGWRRTADAR